MAAGCIQEWIDYDLKSRWIRRYYTYPTGRWTDWKEAPLFTEQFVKSSEKGQANGIATLNKNGAIDSSQIPSYLENPLVYATRSEFPATGRPGKLYMDEQTGNLYVYGGTDYKEYTEHIGNGMDIASLPEKSIGDDANIFLVNDGTNKKITFANIKNFFKKDIVT